MTRETVNMTLKGVGFVGAAVALQYGQALGQWSNSGEWPTSLQWHMIVAITLGSGFNALVAFMSGSYTSWKANGKTPETPTTETKDK